MQQQSYFKYFIAVLMSVFALTAFAQERGTAAEAQAMVEKALAHIKAVGTDKAFKDFTDNTDGKWRAKDLYVFAGNDDIVMVAHGASKGLVGKDMKEIKDAKGKSGMVEMMNISKSAKGHGWYDYDWTDPVTKKSAAKSTYVARIPGYNGFVGVGIYK